MATSKYQWSSILAEENILDTPKMFFGKYLCRAHFNVSAARLIYGVSDLNLKDFKAFVVNRNRTDPEKDGTVYRRRESDLVPADPKKLYAIYQACKHFKDRIKVRVEGGNLHIYAITEEILASFFSYALDTLGTNLVTIHRPASLAAELRLLENVIFVKEVKYDYKVLIREGKYDVNTKIQVANYLNTFGLDTIYVPPNLVTRLTSNHPYVYGYFYTNDPDVVTFIQLIYPTLLGKIYKLEETPDK